MSENWQVGIAIVVAVAAGVWAVTRVLSRFQIENEKAQGEFNRPKEWMSRHDD